MRDARARPSRTRDGRRRVLHVLGSLDRGGAETRTVDLVRHLGDRFAFDFCVLSGRDGALAPTVRGLGARILPCPLRHARATFPLRFARLLARGRYDVVHSHVYQFAGVVLLAARLTGVPVRIAHLRTVADGRPATLARRFYRMAMRALVDANATAVVGVAEEALASYFGPEWRRDPRRRIVYNGIDLERFAHLPAPATVRAELGLAPDATVLIHVGSFTPAKNHAALVAIVDELAAQGREVETVLVGDGPLRAAVAADVERRGLGARFHFLGLRDDVPRLLASADVCVLPSTREGLPGAVLEAIAAGLPVVASPVGGVPEIARRTGRVRTADPATPRAFADAVADALAERPAAAARRPRLPREFTLAASLEGMLACYA